MTREQDAYCSSWAVSKKESQSSIRISMECTRLSSNRACAYAGLSSPLSLSRILFPAPYIIHRARSAANIPAPIQILSICLLPIILLSHIIAVVRDENHPADPLHGLQLIDKGALIVYKPHLVVQLHSPLVHALAL